MGGELGRKIFTDHHKSELILDKAAKVQAQNLHYFPGLERAVVPYTNLDPNSESGSYPKFYTCWKIGTYLTFLHNSASFEFTLFYLSR
jgi:hypothetical protein